MCVLPRCLCMCVCCVWVGLHITSACILRLLVDPKPARSSSSLTDRFCICFHTKHRVAFNSRLFRKGLSSIRLSDVLGVFREENVCWPSSSLELGTLVRYPEPYPKKLESSRGRVSPHAGCRAGGRAIAISVEDLFALRQHHQKCFRLSVFSKYTAPDFSAIASLDLTHGVEGTRIPRPILSGGLGY